MGWKQLQNYRYISIEYTSTYLTTACRLSTGRPVNYLVINIYVDWWWKKYWSNALKGIRMHGQVSYTRASFKEINIIKCIRCWTGPKIFQRPSLWQQQLLQHRKGHTALLVFRNKWKRWLHRCCQPRRHISNCRRWMIPIGIADWGCWVLSLGFQHYLGRSSRRATEQT